MCVTRPSSDGVGSGHKPCLVKCSQRAKVTMDRLQRAVRSSQGTVRRKPHMPSQITYYTPPCCFNTTYTLHTSPLPTHTLDTHTHTHKPDTHLLTVAAAGIGTAAGSAGVGLAGESEGSSAACQGMPAWWRS